MSEPRTSLDETEPTFVAATDGPGTEPEAEPSEATRRLPVDVPFIVAIGLIATAADVTIFRTGGYAGPAVFLLLAPLLMYPAGWRRRIRGPVGLIYGLLAVLAVKLLWCGSMMQVLTGFGLLAGFGMALSGQQPYVLRTLVFASQTFMSGYAAIYQQSRAVAGRGLPRVSRTASLGVVLPVAAVVVFGLLFILANPDLVDAFGEGFSNFAERLRRVLRNFGPSPLEVMFWLAAAWIAAGALRPLLRETLAREGLPGEEREPVSALEPVTHPLFPACRNMLVAVVVLFAAYLAFEFSTLWFREFPEGFHYSGYAHRGAFWLTVSLALATVVLSLVFQGELLDDPRIRFLRKLAWVWSFENLLLAVSVYNRLWIYVGFNGMTRMRVVGLLGTTAVVAGLVLVLVKIAARHDFVWLVRRQLWALAGCVFLYAVLPVDAIVMRYNVSRVLAGDHAPAVQISRHPIDSEGLVQLFPLLDVEDPRIRDGIGALLAERAAIGPGRGMYFSSRAAVEHRPRRGDWTSWQWSEELLQDALADHAEALAPFDDPEKRNAARGVFDQYTYQWW